MSSRLLHAPALAAMLEVSHVRLAADLALAPLLGDALERGQAVDPVLTLAAAVGLGWAEQPRGGSACAVIAGEPPPPTTEAFASARHLGLARIGILSGAAGPAPVLWRWQPNGLARLADLPALSAPPARVPARGSRRREWSPVALPTLPRSGVPPWPAPAPGTSARAHALAALTWLAARHPRLLLPHQMPPWDGLPPTATTATVLAQQCGEGRRVVWAPPPGTVAALAPAVIDAHARGLGLQLLIAPEDLPALDHPLSARAWLLATSDATEASAILAMHVALEDPLLLALLPPQPEVPPAPDAPFRIGSGRVFPAPHGPAQATLVGAATGVAALLRTQQALAAEGIGVQVIQCTSLAPLPFELLAPAPPPLLVVDEPAGLGLAAALARAELAVRPLPAAGLIAAVRRGIRP